MRTSWVRFPPRALTKLQVRGCFLRSGLVALGRDISRRATKSRSRAGDSQRALSGLDVCGGSRPTSSERSSRCAVSGRMSGRVDPRESAQRRDEQHGRGRGARPARQATLASVFRPALPVFSYADQRLRIGGAPPAYQRTTVHWPCPGTAVIEPVGCIDLQAWLAVWNTGEASSILLLSKAP
jgi:hypothetical protein